MVVRRKHSIIKQIKDISIAGSLSIALLGSGMMVQSCDNSPKAYETVYTKGVQTFIEEVEEGQFKIVDERTVDSNSSAAFITYLDGRQESMNVDQVKAFLDKNSPDDEGTITGSWEGEDDQSKDQQYRRHHGGLNNVLFYGGMGYLLGRSFGSTPNQGFYANQQTYSRAQQTNASVKNSRTTKPVNSSKGFFKNSSNRSFGA